jgi:3-phenylpropionate/trans-cinnamate dioxygenase ferredoxin subunit
VSDWTRVCTVSDLADEAAMSVTIGSQPVCVARSAGKFYAVRDVCSHAEVALSEGEVEDGTIECWLHGSRFELSTGRPTGLPANRPVPTYAVKVEGDEILVSLSSRRPRATPLDSGAIHHDHP